MILRWVTGLVWSGDELTSVIIFLIGVLPSLPVYMFLYGLSAVGMRTHWKNCTVRYT